MDKIALLKRMNGNKTHLEHLICLFTLTSPDLLRQIENCILSGDHVGLKKTLHTLKGGIVTFGKGDAYQAILDFEACVRNSYPSQLEAITQFKYQRKRLCQELDVFLKFLRACLED